MYPLNEKDTLECKEDGDIDGYIKLMKNKYITWYSIEAHSAHDNTQY